MRKLRKKTSLLILYAILSVAFITSYSYIGVSAYVSEEQLPTEYYEIKITATAAETIPGLTASNQSELLSAINFAGSGDTIKITNDIKLNSAVAISKSLCFVADSQTRITVGGTYRHMNVTGDEIVLSFDNIILDGLYSGGTATAYGGINTSANHLTLVNAMIKNCYQASNGGGISVAANKRLTVDGGEIVGNTSTTNGGGIYGAASCNINVSGGVISRNFAGTNGGGIYGAAGSNVVVDDSSVIGGDTEYDGNEATNRGGGICIYVRSADISLTIDNTKISLNRAAYGGGIGVEAVTPGNLPHNITVCNSSEIIGNYAKNNGGGIHDTGTYGNSSINISDSVISGNKSDVNGGAASISNSIISAVRSIISDNNANNGGGIYGSGISDINIIDSSVTSNSASQYGGAIYTYNSKIDGNGLSGPPSFMTGKCSILVEGCLFAQNNAQYGGGIGLFNEAKQGAGINFEHWVTVKSSQNSKSVFSGNSAVNGGAIYGYNIATNSSNRFTNFYINIEDSEIIENTATDKGGGIYMYSDGDGRNANVYFNKPNCSGNLTLNNGVISNNTAVTGGGVYSMGIASGVPALCVISVNNGEIKDNEATGGNGGGICSDNYTEIYIQEGEVSHNKADIGNGGGIFSKTYGLINIFNGVVSNNTAVDGGGIYGAISDSTLAKNNSIINISESDINDNSAEVNGGGIYSGEYTNLKLSDSSIYNNTALDGGGIYQTVPNSALFAVKSMIDISGGDISNNSAIYGSGGGIYISKYASLAAAGTAISSNTAKSGGGIYSTTTNKPSSGKYTILMSDSEILANSAISGNGGGVYAGGNTVTNAAGGKILSNTATGDGGGIYTDNRSNLTLNSIKFDNNTAREGYRWTLIGDTDSKLHGTNILNTSYSTPFTNAYSNFDINYYRADSEIILVPTITIRYYKDSVAVANHITEESLKANFNANLANAITGAHSQGWLNLYKPEKYGEGVVEESLPEIVTGNIIINVVYPRLYSVTYVAVNTTGGAVPVNTNLYASGESFYAEGNSGSLVKGAYYTFVGWQDITGTYFEREKYDIASADVVLYALWRLEAPEINAVVSVDKEITGQGQPNAKVKVTFPDGSTGTTIVDSDGNWSLDVPEGTEVNQGDTIRADQSDDEGRRSKESEETVASSVPEDTGNNGNNTENNTGNNTEDKNLNGNDTDTGTGVDLGTEGETNLGSENDNEGLDETNKTGSTGKIDASDDTTLTPNKPLAPSDVSNPPAMMNAIADSPRPPVYTYNGSDNPVTAVYDDTGSYIIYNEGEVPLGFVVVPENESIETVILDEYMIPLGAPDINERLDEQLKNASDSVELKVNPSTGYYENNYSLSLKFSFGIIGTLIIMMCIMLVTASRKRRK